MEVKEIKLSDIRISNLNTRKDLQSGTEDSSLDDLANSIKEKGLLNPITVKKNREGGYDLIVGQRRFLACKKLGLESIPAIIRDELDDTDATIISLIENVHRADMNPLDKANALQKIHEKYEDYKKVENETGISIPTIKRYLNLLNLAPSIQEALTTSEGPAGIGTLSKLAETFASVEDQEKVFKEIKGFKQSVQLEIIKRSGGDTKLIPSLKERALEGEFATHLCHGIDECIYIPEDLIDSVKKIVKEVNFGINQNFLRKLPANLGDYIIEASRSYQNGAYTACCSMLGNVLMGLIESECERLRIELRDEELKNLRDERKSIFEEKLERLENQWKKEGKSIKQFHKTLLEVGKLYRDLSDHPTGKIYKESDAKLFMNTLIVVMKELFE